MDEQSQDSATNMKDVDQVDLLKSILSSTTEYAIFAKNLDHIILAWNEGAKQIYGYESYEVINQSSSVLYDPHDIASGKINKIFQEVKNKGMWSGELKGVTKKGRFFNALANISLRKNLKGEIVGYTFIARDLTELQKVLRILNKLKESQATLNIINKKLHEKIIEVEEANKLKSEFVANMSHELRTPLNAIIGFSQMMRQEKFGTLAPKYKEYIAIVMKSAGNLLNLINDLLDLSKISSGKMEFNFETVDLNELLNEVEQLFNASLMQKKLELEVEIDPTLNIITLDPEKYKQILNNYLSNAIKFSEKNGKLKIKIYPLSEQDFKLEVKDSGIGIKKSDLPHLFKEFQQLDSGSTKNYPGTGLGLALIRKIVEGQGGSVGVKSRYGKGSTFYAILPRRPLIEKKPLQETNSFPPYILIIKNESSAQQLLVDALIKLGYRLGFLDSIKQSIQYVLKEPIRAIILDLLFISDYKYWNEFRKCFFKRRKGDGPRPLLFVVISVLEHSYNFKVCDVLMKPFSETELLASLSLIHLDKNKQKTLLIFDDDHHICANYMKILNPLNYSCLVMETYDQACEHFKNSEPDILIINPFAKDSEGLRFLDKINETDKKGNVIITLKNPDDVERWKHRALAQKFILESDYVSRSLVAEVYKYLPYQHPNKKVSQSFKDLID